MLVRWGGEEFLIVSRYTDRREAELLAQRVLSAVADTPFSSGPGRETMYRTCSLGWAAFPWLAKSAQCLLRRSAHAGRRGLNRAKQSARTVQWDVAGSGKMPPTKVAGLHSAALEVDVLAVTGPEVRA